MHSQTQLAAGPVSIAPTLHLQPTGQPGAQVLGSHNTAAMMAPAGAVTGGPGTVAAGPGTAAVGVASRPPSNTANAVHRANEGRAFGGGSGGAGSAAGSAPLGSATAAMNPHRAAAVGNQGSATRSGLQYK